jgi:hypothetical protein
MSYRYDGGEDRWRPQVRADYGRFDFGDPIRQLVDSLLERRRKSREDLAGRILARQRFQDLSDRGF